ncbi:hypothetical protein [Synechococcus sp. 1G10]
MDALRESEGLRSYGQKSLLIDYKDEDCGNCLRVMTQIRWSVVWSMF